MDTPAESFSLVEYLSVFTAFIYGYVATRFFSGWGAMINFRHAIKFSKEHLFWSFLTFGLLIDIWWASWTKTSFIDQTLYYYISLFPTLVFYLISVILFPPFSDDQFLDLKKYFDKVRKRKYILLMALFLAFELNNLFFAPLEVDFYLDFLAIGFCLIGIFFNHRVVHLSILTLAFAMLLTHIYNQPVYVDRRVISDFSLTEYLTVFSAFIYGSIASRFFTAWGIMISKVDRITFSKEHLVWTFLTFGLLIDFWIGSWERAGFIQLNIFYFILSLIVPLAFYALTAVLLPIMRTVDKIDLRIFYLSHKKTIFLFFGITILANTIVANFMEQSILETENIFRLAALVLAATGYLTGRTLIERGVLAIGCATFILKLILDFQN